MAQLALVSLLGLTSLASGAPNAYGGDVWAAAHAKAAAAVSKLNLTEKVGLVTGVGWQSLFFTYLV